MSLRINSLTSPGSNQRRVPPLPGAFAADLAADFAAFAAGAAVALLGLRPRRPFLAFATLTAPIGAAADAPSSLAANAVFTARRRCMILSSSISRLLRRASSSVIALESVLIKRSLFELRGVGLRRKPGQTGTRNSATRQ